MCRQKLNRKRRKTMKKLIGVCGFIGSGKGTVGDYLEKEWGFKKDSFAKPMKDAAAVIFDWNREMLEGDTSESRKWREMKDEYWSNVFGYEFTPRIALQLLGTEAGRDVFHNDLWAASLISRWKNSDCDVVVTDARFQNELNVIKMAGGVTMLVKRGKDPDWYSMMARYNKRKYENSLNFLVKFFTERRINRLRKKGIIPHISETDWIGYPFDVEIYNNNTIEILHITVDNAVKNIL
jgi:hypothetical protein